MTSLALTRRSFLKGLLVLSASAAVPVELTKAVEFIYSDEFLVKTPPLYILIDGQIVPIYGLIVDEPLDYVSRIYSSSGIGKYSMNTPDVPFVDITFLSDGKIDSFLHGLREFNFEINGDRMSYTLKGSGWASYYSVEASLLNEPRYGHFGFNAELEKYTNATDIDCKETK